MLLVVIITDNTPKSSPGVVASAQGRPVKAQRSGSAPYTKGSVLPPKVPPFSACLP